MPRFVQLVALLMVFCLTPGAAEIVENVVHLAADGHMAHAIDDGEHEPEGAEHGCSGTVHLCPCHSSASFVLADSILSVPSPRLVQGSLTRDLVGVAMPAHTRGVDRPPTA